MNDISTLIITEGGKKGEIYPIISSPFKIGRMSDNDIVLKDKIISRYHAEIIINQDAYILRDLGSRNGTRVNDERITRKNLTSGDKITICNHTLSFDFKREDIFSKGKSKQPDTIKPAQDILKDVMDEKAGDVPVDITQKSILNAIYNLSKSILKKSEIRSIFHLIVDIIQKNIEAERIYILIKNQKTKDIKPLFISDIYTRIGKYLLDAKKVTESQLQDALTLQKKKGGMLGTILVKLGHITEDTLNSLLSEQSSKKNKLMLSRTVIDKVMDEEISLLVSDTKKDERFKASKSIFMYGIRSAICVPLFGAERLVGAIYVDNLNANKQFTQDDLNILTTIGNLAAISIEEVNLRAHLRREREARQCLMRYHSPQVVDEIIKVSGTCDVTEKMITVMFTDIMGFTKLSEKLGPMGSASLLNEYFEIIIEEIFKYNGNIDKFIGDAVMAIFGPPFYKAGYTEMAVRAAINIQKKIKKLNKYEIRIGINTGLAVIGNMGSIKRMDYTAIGDTVNIASGLERIAGSGKIYIGETTYKKIKDKFPVSPVGTQKVKGKIIEVDVYEVLT